MRLRPPGGGDGAGDGKQGVHSVHTELCMAWAVNSMGTGLSSKAWTVLHLLRLNGVHAATALEKKAQLVE